MSSHLELQIKKKLDYNTPYYGKLGEVLYAETDFDNFPYNRFFRGVFNNPNPVIYDRKAGYRVLENKE
jgi:hypothetical protein